MKNVDKIKYPDDGKISLSMINLGDMYYYGKGLEKKYAKAFEWKEKIYVIRKDRN